MTTQKRLPSGSLFSEVFFAVAPREQPDDLRARIVDAPKRCDARFDLWLHVLGFAEVATLEESRANFFRLEEAPQTLEKRFRFGVCVAEEDVARRIAKFRIGVQGEMAFLEGEEDDEMTFLDHLRVNLQDVKAGFLGEASQGGDGHLHVEQLVFFAVV